MLRGLFFFSLSLVFGSQLCGAQVSDSKATMIFYFMVADLANRDESIARGFLTSALAVSENEADQLVLLAQEIVAESNSRQETLIANLCNDANQLSAGQLVTALENEDAQVEGTIDESVSRLQTRLGSNSIATTNMKNWIMLEFKDNITEVQPNNSLGVHGIDEDAFYERICQPQPQSSRLGPDQGRD